MVYGRRFTINAKLKCRIWRDLRRTVYVVLAIHRASLITVQPGSISAERDQVRKRKLFVVEVSHVAVSGNGE